MMQQINPKLTAAAVIFLVLIGIYYTGMIGFGRGVTKTDPTEMKLKEYLPYLIEETTGGIINLSADTLINYKVSGKKLLLNLHANESYSEEKTKRKIKESSIKILNKFFADRKDIEKIVLNWHLNLPDVHGNRKFRKVLAIVMTKEKAANINWNDLTAYNISNTTTDYWVHPILKVN
ncbi:hypothetical protein [Sporohalobacter salinus]|uniref:hypothetical protein n=1 Tax=Sporohalobacter salinus TaxID=1494606 RepID=UPI001960A546|nr:hypothetical protein [Sporohalobacter salinus]MBM7623240.1 hypothetical protein [Sporohalobacter salinus]